MLGQMACACGGREIAHRVISLLISWLPLFITPARPEVIALTEGRARYIFV